MKRTRNYPSGTGNLPSVVQPNNNVGDVTNHSDGTCSFKLDTIPEKGLRTIDICRGDRTLFSISISEDGACYQVLEAGQDMDLFTIWDDEV